MAATDVLSTGKTLYDAGGSGDNYAESGALAAPVRQVYDTYVSTAIEADSTISLVNVPGGSKIRSIRIVHEAFGTGVTIKVGDALDDDRYYATATSIAAAGQIDSILIGGLDYEIGTAATDDVIVITTETATADADKTMKVIITYV